MNPWRVNLLTRGLNLGYQGDSDQTYEEINKRVSDGELYVNSHDPSTDKSTPVQYETVTAELPNQNFPVYGNSSVLQFTGK